MSNINAHQIKQYILKLIDAKDKDFAHKTVEYFGVSKSTVYNYVKKMCEEKILKKVEKAVPPYKIVTVIHKFHYNNNGSLGEDKIFRTDIQPLLKGYEKNVFSAWQYAFTEMMNNAIEHSKASQIMVAFSSNPLETRIVIADNGIGIFKNIQMFFKEEKNEELTLDECVSLLFAGKFTTAESCHSGEGIFFTSHLMDEFFILSDNIFFSRDNFNDATVKISGSIKSTLVSMSLNNQTKKTTKEVFDRFSDIEKGFIRTHIPISHMFAYGNPISRSEARRLGELVSDFKEITLDFSGVEEVGQAFCHELFVVWKKNNPDAILNIINACDDVNFMIQRVKNTK
ncbi:MAG: DUF4325 domain-containing protein [Clostridia bacterium]|nr:DUF4325 domain-containing protein [Clostridia bacterium]